MMDITLIICMYNAEKYIEETLESVLAQSKQDFDLLIIDDCSTDNSLQIVEKFFAEHPRQFEIISLEQNQGPAYGRQFAIEHVHTPIIMFCDADDLLYPGAMATLYEKINSDEDLIAVGCYLEYIDEKGKKLGGGLYLGESTKQGFYKKAARNEMIFLQSTAMIRREYLLSVGGYNFEGFPQGKPRFQDYCEDLDLWNRLSDLHTEGKAIIVVPKVLAKYRKATGLSSSSINMIIRMNHVKTNLLRRRNGEKDLSFCEYYSNLSEDTLNYYKKEALCAESLRKGVFYLRKGHIFKAISSISRSIKINPKYIREKIKYNFFNKFRS